MRSFVSTTVFVLLVVSLLFAPGQSQVDSAHFPNHNVKTPTLIDTSIAYDKFNGAHGRANLDIPIYRGNNVDLTARVGHAGSFNNFGRNHGSSYMTGGIRFKL